MPSARSSKGKFPPVNVTRRRRQAPRHRKATDRVGYTAMHVARMLQKRTKCAEALGVQ